MLKNKKYKSTCLLLIGFLIFSCNSKKPENYTETKTNAIIFPAYYNLILPPNIAPLNFIIKEKGTEYRIEISSENSTSIVIQQKSPTIQIPINNWSEILTKNIGKSIKLDIWVCFNKKWKKYNSIHHKISSEPIDPYLTYRMVHAVYLMWHKMGIYQRNITNFEESPITENSSTNYGCINCHSFSKRDPSKMLLHFRILNQGTMFWNNGKLSKVDTRTSHTMSAGVYPAWHPDGKNVAFSVGKLSPHLTTRSDKVIDVSDKASDIVIYNIEHNTVSTIPQLSTNRRENMPAWSADGKYLYFISAPEEIKNNLESRIHCKYDLMRIAYNSNQNKWGNIEMVLSSEKTGMSISMPSVSPDGKFIICSMTDFGYFSIFHKKSDLYIINLATKDFKKLDLNSNSSESYSTWSSNSRWLVFSSKRIDGVFTRPYIAYIDSNGRSHTPFILPQKNPEIYEKLLANFNRPELLTGKIELSPIQIRDLIYNSDQK
jgi:hypothetical protein